MFKSIAAAVSVAALMFAGGTTVASASTSVTPLHSNSVVNVNGNDYFQATNPVWNAPVTAGPANTTDDNFSVLSSGPNSVRFNLVGTNLCVADPGPGYGHVDSIVLRTCNGNQWQAFRVVNRTSAGFASLQSVATNQYIQDNGQFNNLTGVADNRPCSVGVPCPVGTTGVNEPTGSDNQLWRFGGFFHHLVRLSASQSQNTHDGGSLTSDSVNYTVHVVNDGSVDATNLVVHENVVGTAEVVYNSKIYRANVNLGNVETAGYLTTIPAHRSEDVPGVLTAANLPPSVDFTNASDAGGHLTLTHSGWAYTNTVTPADNDAHPSVHFDSATFTETPSVAVDTFGHTHVVSVNPATEVANF